MIFNELRLATVKSLFKGDNTSTPVLFFIQYDKICLPTFALCDTILLELLNIYLNLLKIFWFGKQNEMTMNVSVADLYRKQNRTLY